MPVDITFAPDPAVATRHVQAFLQRDPVRHNVLSTLLEERAATRTPVRCWWAHENGAVRGVVFQSPSTFPVLVSRLDDLALDQLARAVAGAEGPPVAGVNGVVEDASRFAAALATISRRGARPVEGQRIYEVERLVPPPATSGRPRPATLADLELAARWSAAFAAETDSVTEPQPEDRLRRLVHGERLWFWEDAGAPCSTAVVSSSTGGVTRVGFVYTPPEQRRQGRAAAIVAHVSRLVLERGDRCILYTQLSNPSSNAVYQRLGYRPVHECMRYGLDLSSPA